MVSTGEIGAGAEQAVGLGQRARRIGNQSAALSIQADQAAARARGALPPRRLSIAPFALENAARSE